MKTKILYFMVIHDFRHSLGESKLLTKIFVFGEIFLFNKSILHGKKNISPFFFTKRGWGVSNPNSLKNVCEASIKLDL